MSDQAPARDLWSQLSAVRQLESLLFFAALLDAAGHGHQLQPLDDLLPLALAAWPPTARA